MDKDLVTELRLPRVKIPLKPITGFVKENIKEPGVETTEIVKFFINIQGYRRNIFAYMVLILLNLIIIRLLWLRKDNIIIKPVTNTLIINSYCDGVNRHIDILLLGGEAVSLGILCAFVYGSAGGFTMEIHLASEGSRPH